MISDTYDILIIGSGPSGIQAAVQALKGGARVALLDIGYRDENAPVPERPWSELQALPKAQRDKIFAVASHHSSKAGMHLTPARMHMIKNSDQLFPTRSENFFALESTGLGGLGASWGANAFVLSDEALRAIGISPEEIRPYYRAVSEDIGVSGGTGDIKNLTEGLVVQPPLPLDTNASLILGAYERKKQWFVKNGLRLGQSLLAMLSQPLKSRKANPLFDMDFWGDIGKSVYRPRWTLEEIQSGEYAARFTYLTGRQALTFTESDSGVILKVKNIETGIEETLRTKKLLLAGGALGTARLVLASRNDHSPHPLLCNRNIWAASINLRMLGRRGADARHSLAQLTLLHKDALAQIYSYRSLTVQRLALELPVPAFLTLPFLRILQSALTPINIHFPDKPNKLRTVKLGADGVLEVNTDFSPQEIKEGKDAENAILSALRKLMVIPVRISRPMHGASIHYAGTIPECTSNGKLPDSKHVFVADGSSWKSLPAEGLTLTLMANARRVAQNAINELHV